MFANHRLCIITNCEQNILGFNSFSSFERLEYLRLAFIILIQYAFEHNKNIINNIELPDIYEKDNFLHLGNNAIHQLNIFRNTCNQELSSTSIKSLFDVIKPPSILNGNPFKFVT